jgi:hypothetical protein
MPHVRSVADRSDTFLRASGGRPGWGRVGQRYEFQINRAQHFFYMGQHVAVRESNHQEAALIQVLLAFPVLDLLCRMDFAVDLDDKSAIHTRKVRDEGTDWYLSTKPKATQHSSSKKAPEVFLCQGWTVAKQTGSALSESARSHGRPCGALWARPHPGLLPLARYNESRTVVAEFVCLTSGVSLTGPTPSPAPAGEGRDGGVTAPLMSSASSSSPQGRARC